MQQISLALFLLAGWFTSSSLSAQLQLFNGVAFEHEVTPRWGYEVEVEHRQILETGRENRVLILGALNRFLTEHLSVTPGIRVTPYYGEDPTEVRLFTDIYLNYALEGSPFTLEGRLRNQYEFELSDEAGEPEVAVRPRLGVAVALHDAVDLIGEFEIRYRFDEIDDISEYRYTLGMSVNLSTRVSVESFVRLDAERYPEDDVYVAGILVNYVLPDERHRDWQYRRPFGRSLLW